MLGIVRIAIDALLATPRIGGLGAYVMKIIEGLSEIASDELVALVPEGHNPTFPPANFNPRLVVKRVAISVSVGTSAYDFRSHWEQQVLPVALKAVRPDVYLGPTFVIPLRWQGPAVATVHDLAFERSSNYNTIASRNYYGKWAKDCAGRADRIITDSNFVASEVATEWRIPRDRIRVVHLAPCLEFVPSSRAAALRVVALEYGVDRPYVLYVGGTFPRKNVERLLQAYCRLHERVPNNLDLMLVSESSPSLNRLVRRYRQGNEIRVTGFCPPEILPNVYAGAEMLVYPSIYEGFGLPPLEAMMCGTPVIASTGGAIPEIVGNAAILVDPENVEQLAEAMRRVLIDQRLRSILTKRGSSHVRHFSWHLTAARTRAILNDVAASS